MMAYMSCSDFTEGSEAFAEYQTGELFFFSFKPKHFSHESFIQNRALDLVHVSDLTKNCLLLHLML